MSQLHGVGAYEILGDLASGGMAKLFLGRRSGAQGFSRHVVIKVLKDTWARHPGVTKMFIDEGRIASRIDHANVVRLEDLGEEDGLVFLVMEYVHGASLAELLTELAVQKRRFTPAAAVAIAMSVAEGLHAAHETRDDFGGPLHVVHRDVSPQNVLIGAGGEIKVTDFGVAKARDRLFVSSADGALKGKLRYMSPEQMRRAEVDRRADIYSLGIVLWEMLTMRRLFDGLTDSQLLARVGQIADGAAPVELVAPSTHAPISPELSSVVMSALQSEANARPKTARAFRDALRRACPEAAGVDATTLAALVWALAGPRIRARTEKFPALRGGLDTNEALVLPGHALQELTESLEGPRSSASVPPAQVDDGRTLVGARGGLRASTPPMNVPVMIGQEEDVPTLVDEASPMPPARDRSLLDELAPKAIVAAPFVAEAVTKETRATRAKTSNNAVVILGGLVLGAAIAVIAWLLSKR